MRIIVTVDDAYGVAFNKRRQSRDRILCADVLSSLGASDTLVVSPYSLPLFAEGGTVLRVSEDPVSDLGVHEVAFVERTSLSHLCGKITELTVYHWNRRYPQDVSLGFIPTDAGFSLCRTTEFQGSSHDKITKEIFRK